MLLVLAGLRPHQHHCHTLLLLLPLQAQGEAAAKPAGGYVDHMR
jgi:hypothetical protein